MMLESFIPSEICLACRGCCRFGEQGSVWSPLFLHEEIQRLVGADIMPACLFSHGDSKQSKAARIDEVEVDGQFYCPCLDLKTNACRIYPHRPLDCRLYPFLLLKKDGLAHLALDMKCPYTQDPSGVRALAALVPGVMDFLSTSDAKALLKRNPEIIQAYPGDFKILAPLPLG